MACIVVTVEEMQLQGSHMTRYKTNQRLSLSTVGGETGEERGRQAPPPPKDDPFRNPGVARTLGSATGAGAIVDSRASAERRRARPEKSTEQCMYTISFAWLVGWLAGTSLPLRQQ